MLLIREARKSTTPLVDARGVVLPQIFPPSFIADDEEYIVRLVGRVVTVSVETFKLVKELPAVVEEAVTEST